MEVVVGPDQLTASSEYSARYGAREGVLNGRSGWIARSFRKEFLQVDLGAVVNVVSVSTQGVETGKMSCWCTEYHLSGSRDGDVWTPYLDTDGQLAMLSGNVDATGVVSHTLSPHMKRVRFVRFHPLMHSGRVGLRISVLGTEPTQYRDVHANRLQLSTATPARFASDPPLDMIAIDGHEPWIPAKHDAQQYAQFDFGMDDTGRRVNAVTLQGHPSKEHWVTKCMIRVSNTGKTWTTVGFGRGKREAFAACFDNNTRVRVPFATPITTRYIRIYPTEWHGAIALRACFNASLSSKNSNINSNGNGKGSQTTATTTAEKQQQQQQSSMLASMSSAAIQSSSKFPLMCSFKGIAAATMPTGDGDEEPEEEKEPFAVNFTLDGVKNGKGIASKATLDGEVVDTPPVLTFTDKRRWKLVLLGPGIKCEGVWEGTKWIGSMFQDGGAEPVARFEAEIDRAVVDAVVLALQPVTTSSVRRDMAASNAKPAGGTGGGGMPSFTQYAYSGDIFPMAEAPEASTVDMHKLRGTAQRTIPEAQPSGEGGMCAPMVPVDLRYNKSMHGPMARFNILRARNPARYRITRATPDAEWHLDSFFYAFTADVHGATKYTVYEAENPFRGLVTCELAPYEFKAVDSFYAFANARPSTARLNIFNSQAAPLRCKFSVTDPEQGNPDQQQQQQQQADHASNNHKKGAFLNAKSQWNMKRYAFVYEFEHGNIAQDIAHRKVNSVRMSSTVDRHAASCAVDGNSETFALTKSGSEVNWFQLDLEHPADVLAVRFAVGNVDHTGDFRVVLSDTPYQPPTTSTTGKKGKQEDEVDAVMAFVHKAKLHFHAKAVRSSYTFAVEDGVPCRARFVTIFSMLDAPGPVQVRHLSVFAPGFTMAQYDMGHNSPVAVPFDLQAESMHLQGITSSTISFPEELYVYSSPDLSNWTWHRPLDKNKKDAASYKLDSSKTTKDAVVKLNADTPCHRYWRLVVPGLQDMDKHKKKLVGFKVSLRVVPTRQMRASFVWNSSEQSVVRCHIGAQNFRGTVKKTSPGVWSLKMVPVKSAGSYAVTFEGVWRADSWKGTYSDEAGSRRSSGRFELFKDVNALQATASGTPVSIAARGYNTPGANLRGGNGNGNGGGGGADRYVTPTKMAKDFRKQIFRGKATMEAGTRGSQPLGIAKANVIRDRMFRASSGVAHAARFGNADGCWSPQSTDRKPWIKVDLGKDYVVTAIAVQGSPDAPHYGVSAFVIKYYDIVQKRNVTLCRLSGESPTPVVFNGQLADSPMNNKKNGNKVNLKHASVNRTMPHGQIFTNAIWIEPRSWQGPVPCLRFELYGYPYADAELDCIPKMYPPTPNPSLTVPVEVTVQVDNRYQVPLIASSANVKMGQDTVCTASVSVSHIKSAATALYHIPRIAVRRNVVLKCKSGDTLSGLISQVGFHGTLSKNNGIFNYNVDTRTLRRNQVAYDMAGLWEALPEWDPSTEAASTRRVSSLLERRLGLACRLQFTTVGAAGPDCVVDHVDTSEGGRGIGWFHDDARTIAITAGAHLYECHIIPATAAMPLQMVGTYEVNGTPRGVVHLMADTASLGKVYRPHVHSFRGIARVGQIEYTLHVSVPLYGDYQVYPGRSARITLGVRGKKEIVLLGMPVVATDSASSKIRVVVMAREDVMEQVENSAAKWYFDGTLAEDNSNKATYSGTFAVRDHNIAGAFKAQAQLTSPSEALVKKGSECTWNLNGLVFCAGGETRRACCATGTWTVGTDKVSEFYVSDGTNPRRAALAKLVLSSSTQGESFQSGTLEIETEASRWAGPVVFNSWGVVVWTGEVVAVINDEPVTVGAFTLASSEHTVVGGAN